MPRYFAKDYPGQPFRTFDPPHLVTLGLIVLLNLALATLRGAAPPTLAGVRYTLAAIILLNELAWHLWHIATRQWTLQTMLPLHLCSVMVYLSAFTLITRQPLAYELLYFMGIGAASQALFTPDLGPYGFPHFRYWQTFISHGLLVSVPIYLTVVEGFRPEWFSLVRVAVGMNVYVLLVGGVNKILGSNYLFIAHKPETASLLDYLGPWPWYILSLEAIGFVLSVLLYLPFVLFKP